MRLKTSRKLRRSTRVRKPQVPDPWTLFEPKRLEYGYDYVNMAGVFDGKYVGCVTEKEDLCGCYGCQHGTQVPGPNAYIVERRTRPTR